jgi:hypothetical protein
MKKNILVLILFISISSAMYSQQGVYLNVNNFRDGKLEHTIDCSAKKSSIKLNLLLDKPYITITHDGQSTRLNKGDIFGYRDCKGNMYRFIGKRPYTILNPSEEILLYRFQIAGSKNQNARTLYKFSVSRDQQTYDLTIDNLKRALPDYAKFHDQLTAVFDSDSELTKYDSFYKTYHLNRIYQISK